MIPYVTDPADNHAALLDFPASSEAADATVTAPERLATRVGHLVEWTAGDALLVDFEGNAGGPLPARTIVRLDATTIANAIAERRGVLLCFEDGRPDAPIITGLLQSIPARSDADADADVATVVDGEARVDGSRVELEGRDEVVLRCGHASVTLRRNGRVVIRGTYVETRSRGVNRVKGGSVEIN